MKGFHKLRLNRTTVQNVAMEMETEMDGYNDNGGKKQVKE